MPGYDYFVFEVVGHQAVHVDRLPVVSAPELDNADDVEVLLIGREQPFVFYVFFDRYFFFVNNVFCDYRPAAPGITKTLLSECSSRARDRPLVGVEGWGNRLREFVSLEFRRIPWVPAVLDGADIKVFRGLGACWLSIFGGVARLEVGVEESTCIDEVARFVAVLTPVLLRVAGLVVGFGTEAAEPVVLEVAEPRR